MQYLAHYMPDVSAYTTPLAGCVKNNRPFECTPLLDKCLQSIKAPACKVLIVRRVDPKNTDPIWVITDGSKLGIGAVYRKSPEWQTCRLAGFLSKKFSVAQQHYRTHKHETIAMLKALMKWEDKLLGQKFTLVTDHKGLKYFETQKNLSDRQVQWWEFLSRFNFTIMHIDDVDNKVADCLSRYYENDMGDKSHLGHIYVNAGARLDPDSELLPTNRYMELKTVVTRRSNCLAEKKEAQIVESEEMNDSAQ
jgi:RNase H-like domain found in reverse transcriptase